MKRARTRVETATLRAGGPLPLMLPLMFMAAGGIFSLLAALSVAPLRW